jgi:hypothetical protein
LRNLPKLAFVLVGAGLVIAALAVGSYVFLSSGVEGTEAEMRSAPGTDELRALGCGDAMVADLGAAIDAAEGGEGQPEGEAGVAAKPLPLTVRCAVAAEAAAPTCEQVGETYAKAVPDAPPLFNVTVAAGEGAAVAAVCSGVYDKAAAKLALPAGAAQQAAAEQAGEEEQPPAPPPPSAVKIALARKGMLFVDEEKVGRTKKHEVELGPGEHNITVQWNKKKKIEHTLVVEPFKSYTVTVLRKRVKVAEKDVEPPPSAEEASDDAAGAAAAGEGLQGQGAEGEAPAAAAADDAQ